jgi:hypothetical protein
VILQGLRLTFLTPTLTEATLDGHFPENLKQIPKLLLSPGESNTGCWIVAWHSPIEDYGIIFQGHRPGSLRITCSGRHMHVGQSVHYSGSSFCPKLAE